MYDVNTHLKAMKKMKEVLDKEELDPYLMCQPIGWMCPEVEDQPIGYMSLPECPLGTHIYLQLRKYKLLMDLWTSCSS